MSTGGAGDGPGRGGQAGAAALVVNPRAGRGSGPRCPAGGLLAVGSGPRCPASGLPGRGFRPTARCSWGPEFGPARRPRPVLPGGCGRLGASTLL